ncbi:MULTISPECIES: hypothetical protein [Vitreoscilla]|uniref:Uncharacterized protein n=1 Tax=Vitreoscilla stercoraria TaxID=61 RepID=A0ABY4EBJ6_VITST|nr:MULTISPECIES: hypothetical protein [Vitreoscilla]UOO92676.1 hypothetical protein LVJ81_01095 [Vitreoscilla stercoraria]
MLNKFLMLSMLLMAVFAIGLGVRQGWVAHGVSLNGRLGSSQPSESASVAHQWQWCLAVVVPLVVFLFLI